MPHLPQIRHVSPSQPTFFPGEPCPPPHLPTFTPGKPRLSPLSHIYPQVSHVFPRLPTFTPEKPRFTPFSHNYLKLATFRPFSPHSPQVSHV